jgi:hypothetical protein
MNLIASTVPNASANPALASLDAPYAVTPIAAAGASPLQGLVPITGSGVTAITLATPVAGLPSAGGNDHQKLRFVDTTGHAHTVTTASNKIAPSHSVLTFGGTVGSFVELYAYNGLWYVAALSGVTPS